jgi:3-dehydroquinate synthase
MTQVLIQRFQVPLEYPVYFTRDAFAVENLALVEAIRRKDPSRPQRCLFVVEARVAELWPGLVGAIQAYVTAHSGSLQLAIDPLVIAGAEACKNDPAALSDLQSRFEAARMDRHATIVIVGGGALQDLVGYAAATTHRGVRVIRVPTTVLSQGDSGVGVKNGINAFGKKNFLGTFAAPFAVLIDPNFLRTLPVRDAVAGMAEAIKVGLIKDAAFFDWMRANAAALARVDDTAVAHLVQRCAELHLNHIATGGDPFEFGSARPLDFGHWAAHKLETLTAYRVSHGEAVAIGIALDTRYCVEAGMIDEASAQQVIGLIEQLGLPLWDAALEREGAHGLEVLHGLEEFREHLGGELTVTLLDGIGRGREVHALDLQIVRSSLRWLRARALRREEARRSELASSQQP